MTVLRGRTSRPEGSAWTGTIAVRWAPVEGALGRPVLAAHSPPCLPTGQCGKALAIWWPHALGLVSLQNSESMTSVAQEHLVTMELPLLSHGSAWASAQGCSEHSDLTCSRAEIGFSGPFLRLRTRGRPGGGLGSGSEQRFRRAFRGLHSISGPPDVSAQRLSPQLPAPSPGSSPPFWRSQNMLGERPLATHCEMGTVHSRGHNAAARAAPLPRTPLYPGWASVTCPVSNLADLLSFHFSAT